MAQIARLGVVITGLLLSVWLDLPSGAAILWAMALAGAGVMLRKRQELKL